jgi:hypothetical protein
LSIAAALPDARLTAVASLRDEIAGIAQTTYAPEADVSFDVRPDSAHQADLSYSWFADTRHALSDLVDSIRSLLAKLAPVTTVKSAGAGMAAATIVRYDGRVQAAWSVTSSSAFADVHIAALDHTYALRQAFAAAIAAAGGTLISISASAASPLTIVQAFARARALKLALERLGGLVEHG